MSHMNLGGIGNLGDDSSVALRKMQSYLIQLTEQLRYVLNNIEADNLAPDVLETFDQMAQTSEMIRTVKDELGNYSTIKQTENMISTEVADVDGRVSQVEQTASSLSSSVSSLSGEISSVRQTASNLSSSVSTLNGQVSSLIEQTSDGVAVKLHDETVDRSLTVQIGTSPSNSSLVGIDMTYNGQSKGGLFTSGYDGVALLSNEVITISAGNTSVELDPTANWMQCSADLVPALGNTYDIGYSSGGRWRYIYTNNSVNTSDRRLKRDVAPLNAADLLTRLRPVRYRLKDDPEGAKIKFGFIAQDVAEAIQGTDYEDAELYHDLDPEHLSLCYTELIAVLVEGYQCQQTRMDALDAQLDAYEQRLYALGKGDNERT